MDTDEPLVLRVLAVGNRLLQRMGRYFTVAGVTVAVGVVSTSQCFYSYLSYLFRGGELNLVVLFQVCMSA